MINYKTICRSATLRLHAKKGKRNWKFGVDLEIGREEIGNWKLEGQVLNGRDLRLNTQVDENRKKKFRSSPSLFSGTREKVWMKWNLRKPNRT